MFCNLKGVARLLALDAAAALLVVLVFSGVTWQTPWRSILESFGVSMLFSNCIGPLIALTMPYLVPAVKRRVGFPLDWSIIIGAMVVIGVVGSVVALTILRMTGYLAAGRFAEWFFGSLRISVIATLTFGVFGTALEMLRAQLDATTLALRTKERDAAESRRLAAEARLASLESRVQPHFLFNTLNSIAALIHDDPDGAERMTAQLASLLRSSLDQQAALISIDEELRIVRNYLDIERVRFGDRLRFDIQMDAAAESARVPRMAVQTLVENSVKYAVSSRREGATIAVSAAASNGHVQITVRDDGPGFDPATASPGHGLALVRERLAMTLGDGAQLRVEAPSGGSMVVIDLPSTERRATSTEPRAMSTVPRAPSHEPPS
jgi:sensor histidine kinase YesM